MRRIINCDARLSHQLDTLKSDFLECKYPEKMIENIFEKIKKLPRVLERKDDADKQDKMDAEKLLVVSTHGCDRKLMKIIKDIEKKTETIEFTYLKKTGPSLQNLLVKSKRASLGDPFVMTEFCKRKKCQTCRMVSEGDYVIDPTGKQIRTAKAKCFRRCSFTTHVVSIATKYMLARQLRDSIIELVVIARNFMRALPMKEIGLV